MLRDRSGSGTRCVLLLGTGLDGSWSYINFSRLRLELLLVSWLLSILRETGGTVSDLDHWGVARWTSSASHLVEPTEGETKKIDSYHHSS